MLQLHRLLIIISQGKCMHCRYPFIKFFSGQNCMHQKNNIVYFNFNITWTLLLRCICLNLFVYFYDKQISWCQNCYIFTQPATSQCTQTSKFSGLMTFIVTSISVPAAMGCCWNTETKSHGLEKHPFFTINLRCTNQPLPSWWTKRNCHPYWGQLEHHWQTRCQCQAYPQYRGGSSVHPCPLPSGGSMIGSFSPG